MIRPHIGARVLYWGHEWDFSGHSNSDRLQRVNTTDEPLPMAATIINVHNDTVVALLVVDHMGGTHSRLKVEMVQPDAVAPADGAPYGEYLEQPMEDALMNPRAFLRRPATDNGLPAPDEAKPPVDNGGAAS